MAADGTVKAAGAEASKMLGRKKEEAILALLTHRTVEDAARLQYACQEPV
jgi:hypothetical protein